MGIAPTAVLKARKVARSLHPDSQPDAQSMLGGRRSSKAALRPPAETRIGTPHPRGQVRRGGAVSARLPGGHPKSAWAWYALGYSLYGQRNIGDSIKALAQSLQLDVNNADAHKVLGRDLMIIGRFDAAKIEFEQGKRLNPNSAEMPYNLGQATFHSGQLGRRPPRVRSRHPAGSLLYGSLRRPGIRAGGARRRCRRSRNYRKAIEMNEARHAGFASPYVNMSALFNRTGDREAAMDYARKALRSESELRSRAVPDGEGLRISRRTEPAADALNRAIAINLARVVLFLRAGHGLPQTRQGGREPAKRWRCSRKLERESNELEQKRRDWIREGAHE